MKSSIFPLEYFPQLGKGLVIQCPGSETSIQAQR